MGLSTDRRCDNYFTQSANDLFTGTSVFVGNPSSFSDFVVQLDDYQLANVINDLNFLDEIAPYLGIGASETAPASADVASAVDPSSFTDLLTAFGI